MSLLAITDAGVLYKDAVFAGQEAQNITRVIFRNIAGLVPQTAIDLTQGVPTSDIVHSEPIERVGALDDNAIVMSTVLGYDVGNFEYNWYGVIAQNADLSEVLIAVVQTPVQTKTKTNGPTTGNYSVKSIVWKTANIAQELNVSLSALPWQVPDNTFVTQAAYDLAMASKLDKTAKASDIGALAAGDSAINADKLNNQPPTYYAKQSDINLLNSLVFSGDSSLNEIQEIVDYIKLNRSDLDALSIASIAGLVAALAGKSGAGHSHTLASLGYRGATNANYFTYSLPSSVVHQTEKSALHLTDALRISGNRVYLYKGDGTYEYIDTPPNTNTHRAISNSVSSTSNSVSASSAAVRAAYNKGNHSHPYLRSSSRAADSYRLEGSTKASVIASARSGLAPSSHSHTVKRTTLLANPSGQTSGHLYIRGWRNYDAIEVVGGDTAGNQATTMVHSVPGLLKALSSAANRKVVLWDNGHGYHWWINGSTTYYLAYSSDNAKIFAIYGIKYT